MEARRRVVDLGGDLPTLNPTSEAAERMRVEDLQLDPAIMKIWDDFEKEAAPPVNRDIPRVRYKGMTARMRWFVIFVCVGILVFFIEQLSTREMHRLKTETRPNAPHAAHEGHWWHAALVYNIVPRSFKDSNQDGVGDIQGRWLTNFNQVWHFSKADIGNILTLEV